MTKKDIIDAWAKIRSIDNSIPDDMLDFMKDCAIEQLENPPMFFSKIYVQKNFVPDVVADPFGREVVGTEVTIERHGDIEQARELAQQYVKDYIQKNTIYDHEHIEIRNVPTVIPDIYVENDYGLNEISIENEIMESDMETLLGFETFVKNKPTLQLAYDKRMFILNLEKQPA